MPFFRRTMTEHALPGDAGIHFDGEQCGDRDREAIDHDDAAMSYRFQQYADEHGELEAAKLRQRLDGDECTRYACGGLLQQCNLARQCRVIEAGATTHTVGERPAGALMQQQRRARRVADAHLAEQ